MRNLFIFKTTQIFFLVLATWQCSVLSCIFSRISRRDDTYNFTSRAHDSHIISILELWIHSFWSYSKKHRYFLFSLSEQYRYQAVGSVLSMPILLGTLYEYTVSILSFDTLGLETCIYSPNLEFIDTSTGNRAFRVHIACSQFINNKLCYLQQTVIKKCW